MMRPGWLTEAQEVEALRIVNEPGPGGRVGGRRALMDAFGIGEKRARTLARWLKTDPSTTAGPDHQAKSSDQWQISKRGGDFKILSKGSSITSVGEAVEKAGLDMAYWYEHETTAEMYTTAMKDGDGSPLIVENWLIKVTLRRRVSEAIHDGLDMIADRIADRVPAYDREFPAVLTGEKTLVEMSLYDHHFGKLSWSPEVGDDYDIKIAEDLYVGAVKDTMSRLGSRRIEKIMLPIGNDFLNYDNARGETAGGTPQDNDSRPHKVFMSGFFAILNAIEILMETAPVDLEFVPGNHDPTWAYHLMVALYGAFRTTDRVNVNIGGSVTPGRSGPLSRKYFEFGNCLVGLEHGDMPAAQWKHLGQIMATEVPEAWGRTRHREFHTGHKHGRKAIASVLYDENFGVVVRQLPSMTPADNWHFGNGYVGNLRLAETYLWNERFGLDGILMSHAPQQQR